MGAFMEVHKVPNRWSSFGISFMGLSVNDDGWPTTGIKPHDRDRSAEFRISIFGLAVGIPYFSCNARLVAMRKLALNLVAV
jgi:hypothetical protein